MGQTQSKNPTIQALNDGCLKIKIKLHLAKAKDDSNQIIDRSVRSEYDIKKYNLSTFEFG